MTLGLPFALMLLLVLGSAIAVIVVAARDRTPPLDPGMGTVRRLFVYLLSALGLVAGANGVTWLLQAVAGAALGVPELTGDTTIALGVALGAVGVPAWLGFWGAARRAIRAHAPEARFLLRQVYLSVLLTAALATATVAAVELVAAALGVATRSAAVPAAVLVVWWAVWAFHGRVERAEPPATEAGRTLRLLHVYVVAVVALAVLALATGTVLQLLLGAAYRALLIPTALWATASPLASDALRLAVATAIVAAVVWWWYGHRLARPATDGWPRAVATYAFGVFPGAAAVVVAVSVLVYQTLQVAFGAGPAVERFAVLPLVLALIVVGGGVWAVHEARARAEAVLDPGQARAGRRISRHLLATIGLVACAVGLIQALVAVFGAVAPVAATLRGDAWRDPTILALTLLAVGGPLWVGRWRTLQRVAGAEPDGERAAGARRIYLTLAFGIGVAAGLVAASVALYEVVVAVLDGRGLAVLWDVRVPLATALVAAAVGGYHGAVLREDREALAEAAPKPAPRARPEVLVVARRRDEDVVRRLEAGWGGHVTVGWRLDDDAPPADVDVEALLDRLEEVATPRVAVVVGSDLVEVVPLGA